MAFTIITQGSFLSTGVNVKIPLPSSVDYFKTYNREQKILILILLIIGFMTAIKFLQLLISN